MVTRIFMPNDMHATALKNNPECIFEIEQDGYKVVPVEFRSDGKWFVCTRCGNRALGIQPPFNIHTDIQASLRIEDGKVFVRVPPDDIVAKIEEAISDCNLIESSPDLFIVQIGRHIISCSSCGGHVAPSEVMLDSCHDSGCGGCIFCGNLEPLEEIKSACRNCHTVVAAARHGYTNKEWRTLCRELGCRKLEASEVYYNLSLVNVLRELDEQVL